VAPFSDALPASRDLHVRTEERFPMSARLAAQFSCEHCAVCEVVVVPVPRYPSFRIDLNVSQFSYNLSEKDISFTKGLSHKTVFLSRGYYDYKYNKKPHHCDEAKDETLGSAGLNATQ